MWHRALLYTQSTGLIFPRSLNNVLKFSRKQEATDPNVFQNQICRVI